MPEPSASGSGITGSVMGWYDSAVGLIPNDTARSALALSRGSVESAVEQGGTHAASAQDFALSLRGVSLSAGGLPRSSLLGVRHTNVFIAVPCAAGALALHCAMLQLLHRERRVTSIEAGPDPLRASYVDRLTEWFLRDEVVSSRPVTKYHSVQMLVHGASVVLALYTSRYVLPAKPKVDPQAAESQLVSTARNLANSARALVGGATKNHLPVAIARLVNCAVHSNLSTQLRLALVSYALHSGVVLYGPRANSAVSRKVVRVVHTAATAMDFITGLVAVNSSSLPPLSTCLAVTSFAYAATHVGAADNASVCPTDPLRVALSTVSAAKAVAIVSAATYGVDQGKVRFVKLACLAILGTTLRASSLPCARPEHLPRQLHRSLPGITLLHGAINGAALWSLMALPPGTMLPRVSLAPFTQGTRSLAGILTVVDSVALGVVVAYQLQTKTFVALNERTVRVPVRLESFAQPSPTANATPEQIQQLDREYDFASTVATEKNMSGSYDYLSRTAGDLSTTQTGVVA